MHRFTLKETVEIPRLHLTAQKLKHNTSNLTHIHVQRPDKNNVFGLAFKTDAPDKTGVPHILEHTTLCGSKKYPVRDPFFKMQTRSLANFMNAMTGFDYTYYPFATTNSSDYINLQNVYMDSVFSPLLRKNDFLQEGWRLEHSILEDKSSPLVFKGVVYNEMKGQMSIPAYYFYMAHFMAIYPSMNYSAGDPVHIPELTYNQLLQYHQQRYHPDNCVTYSYGDFDSTTATENLANYLDTVKPGSGVDARVSRELPEPVALTENKKVVVDGPLDPIFDAKKQLKISLSWYIGKPTDFVHTLAWKALTILLSDGHASPFYQALVDSGLGTDLSVNTGLEETPAMLIFTVGLQGVASDDVDKFKTVVFETIDKIVKEGFPTKRVDAIIHQEELADREINANYGLSLLSKIVSRAFHPADDVMKTLDGIKLLQSFKDRIKENPTFFQDELAKMVSTPYFEFQMRPDPEFETKLADKEAHILKSKVNALSDAQKDEIYNQGIELQREQQNKPDVSSLPTVTTADIAASVPEYPVQHKALLGTLPILVRETQTQGISYTHLLRDMSGLRRNLFPYLSIYCEALTSVGSKKHTMAELEDLIKLSTGGIDASVSSKARIGEPLSLEIAYSVYGLDSKLEPMYDLLNETMTMPKLDNIPKLKAIIDASASNVINSLSQSGHRYAVGRASAAISKRRALDSSLGGFNQIKLLKSLSQLNESQLGSELVPKLSEIQNYAYKMRGGLTCTPGAYESHEQQLSTLLGNLSAQSNTGAAIEQELEDKKTHVPTGFQVSYVGAAVKGPEFLSEDSAALSILANLLTHRHLHTEIREKGGAYGGGASYNALDGLFTFYSYRDPSPQKTLETISQSGAWAFKHQWTDIDVEEGKIGLFQGIDAPISPRTEISYLLNSGLDDEMRKQRRHNLLSVTASDLNRVAERYLTGLDNLDNAGVCVVGPCELPDWTRIDI